MNTVTANKPTLWAPGDWNALFGFGTNILVNMLTLTALLRYVLKMPDDLVFHRILPATGLMLCLSWRAGRGWPARRRPWLGAAPAASPFASSVCR